MLTAISRTRIALLALTAAVFLSAAVPSVIAAAGPAADGPSVQRVESSLRTSISFGSVAMITLIMVFGITATRGFAARARMQKTLAESEDRFRMIVDAIREYAVVPLDAEGRVASWNAGAERFFGYASDEVAGRHFSVFFTDEENRRGTPATALRQAAGNEQTESESQLRHKNGTSSWAVVKLRPHRNGNGEVQGFCLVLHDISGRRESEESVKKLMLSLEQATDLVVMTDQDGMVEYVNKAMEDVLGYSRSELIGKTRDIWASGEEDVKARAEREEALQAGRPFQSIVTNRKKNGEAITVYEVTTPLKDANGRITHFISTARDITLQKNMEERLNYLAFFDPLTGIPNRTLFIDRLSQGIARASYGKKIIGVLILDIDGFKFVNEEYGLDAGDRLLKSVTARLQSSIRSGDSIARIGSDDFGILLFDVAEADDIILVVKKVMEKTAFPITEQGNETVITVSIGVAVYPYDGENAQEVMKNADIALTSAKQQGRNNYQFYTKDMNSRAREFVSIDKQLFDCFKNREFMVYYQPYFSTTTRKLEGMEALIRWNSNGTLVPPSTFIPVLEDTGMIIEVGDWITKAVCRQIGEWSDAGYKPLPVSVNISPVQFRKQDLADSILEAVRQSSIDPRLLTLEITESSLMRNVDFARQVLTRLKKEGISISLDDFGTGYSSLGYLQKFPFDNLKIDSSFVRDLALDEHSSTIVSAIIAMARSLSLKTIAEGVETEELWKILRLLQCDMVQGHFFSPPVTASEVETFLKNNW